MQTTLYGRPLKPSSLAAEVRSSSPTHCPPESEWKEVVEHLLDLWDEWWEKAVNYLTECAKTGAPIKDFQDNWNSSIATVQRLFEQASRGDKKALQGLVTMLLKLIDRLILTLAWFKDATEQNDELPFKMLLLVINLATLGGQYIYQNYIEK